MSQLSRGRIIWVTITDREGKNPKQRPAVVISANEEITADGEIWIVACTTHFDRTLGKITVELPWERGGHPKTKLREQCFAICDWLRKVPVSAIEDYAGYLPGKWLLEILRKVKALTDENVSEGVPSP